MYQKETPRTRLESIGGWKLGKTLGRGAYAHVRLATHPNGTRAACKILPALYGGRTTPATDDEIIDAVEAHKEVVLLKSLAGAGLSGIVGLEGVIEEEGWTYVFLALHQNSASDTIISRDHLTVFFRQLCITIHSLHRLGISHEDIKRSNVLLDRKGHPIVVDFGFSHFNPDNKLQRSAGGTLDYSSPEKVQDLLYDPKPNDVWALGIFLIKLLGLPHPFMAVDGKDTSDHIKQRIVYETPCADGWIRADEAGHLRTLLEQMLQKNPAERIDIPGVLRHPSLSTTTFDPPSFRVPPMRLPYGVPIPFPASILKDVCFLAYLNHEFYLCESMEHIKDRILGPHPCWEKRWAGFLHGWKQKEEFLQWEDIPPANAHNTTQEPVTKRVIASQRRALREIHLSPNVAMTDKNAHEKLASKRTDDPRAAPRRSLIKQMKPREVSKSAESVGSTIHVQTATPKNGKTKGKKASTPIRVDFGRRRVSVLMPKLTLSRQEHPQSGIPLPKIYSTKFPPHEDSRGMAPSSLVSKTFASDLRQPVLKNGKISDAVGSLSSDKKESVEGRGKKLKEPKVPVRRSRRIENKESYHG